MNEEKNKLFSMKKLTKLKEASKNWLIIDKVPVRLIKEKEEGINYLTKNKKETP